MAPHVFALAHHQLDNRTIDAFHGPVKPKKRKSTALVTNTDDETSENSGSEEDASHTSGRLSRETSAFVSLSKEEHAQRRLAGLQPTDEVPGEPFPDKSAIGKTNVLNKVREELKELNPPLPHIDQRVYLGAPLQSNKSRDTLRNQHVANLTTVLHLMLQRGDYVRAGRAWALLLRAGAMTRHTAHRKVVGGMDLRAHERWGIGAELLMRRSQSHSQRDDGASDDDSVLGTASEKDGDAHKDAQLDYSPEGFALARKYYERLIIQYPYHRATIGAAAPTFYAAMFSCWIYELNKQWQAIPTRSASESDHEQRKRERKQRKAALASLESNIRALTDRMDEIIDGPPYDKNIDLLQMRAMVELWCVDITPKLKDRHKARMMRGVAQLLRRAERSGADLDEQAKAIVDEWFGNSDDEEMEVDEDEEEGKGFPRFDGADIATSEIEDEVEWEVEMDDAKPRSPD